MTAFLTRGRRLFARLSIWLNRTRKGVVLRAGFGIIIALLFFSSLQANRIQDAAARQSFELYQRYAKQQEVLGEFRRTLLLGSVYARDFFLSPWPDRSDAFNSSLEHLRIDANGALDEISRMEGLSSSLPQLRAAAKAFLDVLATVPDESAPDRTFEVVDRGITEKRVSATRILENLIAINREALKRSDAELGESRRRAGRNLFLMLGFTVFIGLGVALFSIFYAEALERRSAERYEEVVQAKSDLQRLSARILDVQEEERRRFARELHDEIGQSLTALRMEIAHAQAAARASEPQVNESLNQARKMAEKTTQAVRDISLLLRPSLLDDLGLLPALEWQAEEFTRRSGIACQVINEGLPAKLPDAANTGVYRIVQEALHNAEKHSAARNVRVVLHGNRQVLTAEIADDGAGFEVEDRRRPGGLGLLGMRERAEGLGGHLRVDSKPGAGTKITLRLPLSDAAGDTGAVIALNQGEVPHADSSTAG